MSSVHQAEATRAPRYRGVSYTKPIDAAKEAVPVTKLADKLSSERGLRRRCPLPDHEDHTPSFVLYPETESFFCFGCLRGGDVVELYRLAKGYEERDAHTAAAMLLMEFGYEPPQTPPSWHRKQERQKKMRNAVDETRHNVLCRRLFRHLILPLIDAIEDEEERNRELQRAWSEFRRLAA
jgi:CHC2 zinc finger